MRTNDEFVESLIFDKLVSIKREIDNDYKSAIEKYDYGFVDWIRDIYVQQVIVVDLKRGGKAIYILDGDCQMDSICFVNRYGEIENSEINEINEFINIWNFNDIQSGIFKKKVI